MKINNIIRCLALLSLPLLSGMGCGLLSSCTDDSVDSNNYYTATKRTAAQLISDSPERFSQFEAILERANYKSTLSTYGTFTVFVPDNNAVNTYLKENNYKSVEDIPEEVCDTIARAHIISKGAYFTTDYMAGTLPEMNMDDRYVVITCDSDVNNNNQLLLYVNKLSKIVEKDDSVTNGVVHIIDRLLRPSNETVADLMETDETITLFTQAMKLTHMNDSLTKFIDETYSCSYDSVKGDNLPLIRYGGKDMAQTFPEKRYFKFTAFVEPDEVFNRYNIFTLQDLIDYAKKVYDKTFPLDAGKYDDDFTNRKNPLNRFVSYHLMDRIGTYSDWAPTGEILTTCCKTNIADAEDFWQTMLDTEGMIRFSRHRATEQLYINRKGKDGKLWKGIKVLDALESGKHEQNAINGIYHYLDDILVYDTNTRDNVLNCRMRIDATTLSADFMNQNCRGHIGSEENHLFCLKNNYIKGWKVLEGTSVIAVHTGSASAYWADNIDNFATANPIGSYGDMLGSSVSSEVISMIPMEDSEFYGIMSDLPNIFRSTETNYNYFQVTPSKSMWDYSAAENYCYVYTSKTGKDTIIVPKEDLQKSYYAGDLRFSGTYTYRSVNRDEFSKYSTEYQNISKQNGMFVATYRIQQVYLMFAEALNRAGYPETAFAILKYGLTNLNIGRYISEKEREAAASMLNFNDDEFTENNTQGIHSRGCGDAKADTTYVLPMPASELASYADTVAYQIPLVEDMIMREMTLEEAFEGQRYYNLMRISLRRNDPAYLAKPIANRTGEENTTLLSHLMDKSNWYLPIE